MTEARFSGAPETKGQGGSADVGAAFEEFMATFEAFRDANDQRLAQIETRMGADVVTSEKVERIGQALDEQKRVMDRLVLKQARPPLGPDAATSAARLEHKEAFEAYMRRGDERALRAVEAKAMSYGSGPDGGYLVPDEIEREIGRRLAAISPIRGI